METELNFSPENLATVNKCVALYSTFRAKNGNLYLSFKGRNDIKFIFAPKKSIKETDSFEKEKLKAVKEWCKAVQEALNKDNINTISDIDENFKLTITEVKLKEKKKGEKRTA